MQTQQTAIASSIQYHFMPVSSNVKTGKIPVTSADRDSCPTTCPLKGDGGCYGENYGVNFHWNALDGRKRGGSISDMCTSIAALPAGQLWRGNQVGDLAHDDGEINAHDLGLIVQANIGKRGFTYTHHLPEIGQNAYWIKSANDWGYTVNLSANDLAQADDYAALGIAPVVTLLDESWQGKKHGTTPAGRKVIVCPVYNDKTDAITCKSCQLCQRQDRPIIGFIGHGSRAAKVINIARVQ